MRASKRQPPPPVVQPALQRAQMLRCAFGGLVGERLKASVRNWFLVAPEANPAMLDMFRERDCQPARDLLPWSGEFAGKYLTSAVQTLRASRHSPLRNYLRKWVPQLVATQAADGYLGPFPADRRLLGEGLWDLWGHYHCMLGLLLWHQESGDVTALAACRRMADLLCRTFLDGGRRVVEAGSEEMNQSLAHGLLLLYRQTGEERYSRLARETERDWEMPTSGDYVRTALAGIPFHATPKPRWESLHAVQAIAELYLLTGDGRYRQAFEQIWWSIVEGDRHNSGGFSSGEQATGNPYDPRPIETCCTIAWMALTLDMLRMTGDPMAADELELSTFNAVLGAQNGSGRWWTYDTPMDGVRKASAHDIVFQARPGSPELNCCSVNGPRGLGLLSEWAVMTDGKALVLNYYGPARFKVRPPSGTPVELVQEGPYPQSSIVRVKVVPRDRGCRFGLRLRIPHWSATTHLFLNGERQKVPAPGSYVEFDRRWDRGDEVHLNLDFSLRVWPGERDAEGRASVFVGPVLLAYDTRLNPWPTDQIPPLDAGSMPRKQLGDRDRAWVRHAFSATGGEQVVLCDFATAGAGGSEYRSWLPVRGLRPVPFSRVNPLRTVLVGGVTP